MANESRLLLVTADDFGIGLETSRGILDLAEQGVVTSTVLLVNSPFAEESVQLWHDRGQVVELGWHPCLTLDRPVLPPEEVPSLVDARGRFFPLGVFLKKLLFKRINPADILAELTAQYDRFQMLVGVPPRNINGHHHVHLFRPVRDALDRVLSRQSLVPYVRRVRESWRTLWRIPGGRLKRAWLSRCSRATCSPLPSNDELLGITDPWAVHQPDFFTRWLTTSTGRVVELTCHPGYFDRSLEGRDSTPHDGQMERRTAELARLGDPRFLEAVQVNGFRLVSAEEIVLTRRMPFSSRISRIRRSIAHFRGVHLNS